MVFLKNLTYKNFFLFEQLNFSPSKGLNILTGESGAGKTLFLEGIKLLMGGRLDGTLVSGLENKAILEGVFETIDSLAIKEFFEENDLDEDKEIIIRREITPAGKNRCFINDSPVNVQTLKILGEKLCEVHNQHETTFIKSNNYQIAILDKFSNSSELQIDFKNTLRKIKNIKDSISELEQIRSEAKKEQDYKNFLLEELINAKLDDVDEENTLEEEQTLLANASEIATLTDSIGYTVEDGEQSLETFVSEIRSKIRTLSQISHLFESDYKNFESAWIELKEVIKDISKKGENITIDPARLQETEDRLALIQDLKRKHNAINIAELIEISSKLSENLQDIDTIENKINDYKIELERSEHTLTNQAKELSKLRKENAPKLSEKVTSILSQLEIPKASFQIEVETLNRENWTSLGADKVTFLFSANAGIQPKNIESVASGGELSRLMLSFKSFSKGEDYLTIFDEIDTGVSGETAMKVGKLISQMGQNSQLLVITHLPQVACKGDTHFLIKKHSKNDKSTSNLIKLEGENRILEIARLLSGKIPGEKAIKNAEELLQS